MSIILMSQFVFTRQIGLGVIWRQPQKNVKTFQITPQFLFIIIFFFQLFNKLVPFYEYKIWCFCDNLFSEIGQTGLFFFKPPQTCRRVYV